MERERRPSEGGVADMLGRRGLNSPILLYISRGLTFSNVAPILSSVGFVSCLLNKFRVRGVGLRFIMAETRGPTVTAVAISFAVISAVAIILRLWSRLLVVKTFGADDGLYSKEPWAIFAAANNVYLGLICVAVVSRRRKLPR